MCLFVEIWNGFNNEFSSTDDVLHSATCICSSPDSHHPNNIHIHVEINV